MLLEKDVFFFFVFNEKCLSTFQTLKKAFISTPTIIDLYWNLTFKMKCNANDNAIGTILGSRRNRIFHAIYYASHTLLNAWLNYITIEKKVLVVIFTFDKLRAYLIGS